MSTHTYILYKFLVASKIFYSWNILNLNLRRKLWNALIKNTTRFFTLCIESMFWGLQYSMVWGSSIWDQTAHTEAWQPCVTTLPRGHVSIRSRRSTTYWTSTSEFSAFTPLPSSGKEGSLIEFEARVQTRRGEEKVALIVVIDKGDRELEDVKVKANGEARRDAMPIATLSGVKSLRRIE